MKSALMCGVSLTSLINHPLIGKLSKIAQIGMHPDYFVMMFCYDPTDCGWLNRKVYGSSPTLPRVFGDPHKDRQAKVKPNQQFTAKKKSNYEYIHS